MTRGSSPASPTTSTRRWRRPAHPWAAYEQQQGVNCAERSNCVAGADLALEADRPREDASGGRLRLLPPRGGGVVGVRPEPIQMFTLVARVGCAGATERRRAWAALTARTQTMKTRKPTNAIASGRHRRGRKPRPAKPAGKHTVTQRRERDSDDEQDHRPADKQREADVLDEPADVGVEPELGGHGRECCRPRHGVRGEYQHSACAGRARPGEDGEWSRCRRLS